MVLGLSAPSLARPHSPFTHPSGCTEEEEEDVLGNAGKKLGET